jgi:hypothetical protein
MNAKLIKIFLGVLALAGTVIMVSTGCSSKSPAVTAGDIQPSMDPVEGNILTSLHNDDYAGFSRDFNQTLKNTLNKSAFDLLYSQTKTLVGDYQSSEFLSAGYQNGTLTVGYIAQYSKEPAGVVITLVAQAHNDTFLVQGLNFDSPNLHGQPLDVDTLRAFADPETENVLLTLNSNDYAGFSRDFQQTMKNALPQTAFNKLYGQIKSKVGDYQSKKYESAAVQNNVFMIRYLAKYSSEPAGVWVTISFDTDQKVEGLYFNSPKLQ